MCFHIGKGREFLSHLFMIHNTVESLSVNWMWCDMHIVCHCQLISLLAKGIPQ